MATRPKSIELSCRAPLLGGLGVAGAVPEPMSGGPLPPARLDSVGSRSPEVWWVVSWFVYWLDGTPLDELLERLLSMQVFP